MKNPDFEQWFDLENIEFDAWNPNYQPVTENYLGNGDGARHGDNIAVSFDKPLQGTRMWGEVISDNIIKVYHRNDTGVTVDLPSGALKVKIV